MQKGIRYALGVDVWFAEDRADWSNAFKAVEDALQCAGVIWNDRMIVRCLGGDRNVDKQNPRIEFELRRL